MFCSPFRKVEMVPILGYSKDGGGRARLPWGGNGGASPLADSEPHI